MSRPSWPWAGVTGGTPVLRAARQGPQERRGHRRLTDYINFFDDKSGKAKQVIVQVKSGYVGVNHVRELTG